MSRPLELQLSILSVKKRPLMVILIFQKIYKSSCLLFFIVDELNQHQVAGSSSASAQGKKVSGDREIGSAPCKFLIAHNSLY